MNDQQFSSNGKLHRPITTLQETKPVTTVKQLLMVFPGFIITGFFSFLDFFGILEQPTISICGAMVLQGIAFLAWIVYLSIRGVKTFSQWRKDTWSPMVQRTRIRLRIRRE